MSDPTVHVLTKGGVPVAAYEEAAEAGRAARSGGEGFAVVPIPYRAAAATPEPHDPDANPGDGGHGPPLTVSDPDR